MSSVVINDLRLEDKDKDMKFEDEEKDQSFENKVKNLSLSWSIVTELRTLFNERITLIFTKNEVDIGIQ